MSGKLRQRTPANKPATTKDEEEKRKPPRTYLGRAALRSSISNQTWRRQTGIRLGWYRLCLKAVAILIAILIFNTSMYIVFVQQRIMVPGCQYQNGRLCNDQGTCIAGICVCNDLFSGPSCSENQIEGYNINSNSVCNNHGFVLPFLNKTVACQQGWATPACSTFVKQTRTLVNAALGDLLQVPDSWGIPNCLCYAGYGGADCAGSRCPLDENGYICGNHGNTSVGLLYNGTNAGRGCQCEAPLLLYEHSDLFTPSQLNIVSRAPYSSQYLAPYCGNIYYLEEANQLLAFSVVDNYKCYCQQDWQGPACTQGKCPINAQTNAICNGHGHPTLGLGRVVNYTKPTYQDRQCTLKCASDDFVPCPPQGTGAEQAFPPRCRFDTPLPYFKQGTFCDNPQVCAKKTPVRCPTGACAAIPPRKTAQCFLGYETGSIDIGRIQEAVNLYRCPNITTQQTLSTCLRNTTVTAGITKVGNATSGEGFFLESANVTLTLTRDSPLVYFQIISNQTGLWVENHRGERILNTNAGLSAGIFSYTADETWNTPTNQNLILTPLLSQNIGLTGLFAMKPMPWNYTGSSLYNSTWKAVKVFLPGSSLEYVFQSVGSNISITDTFDAALATTHGILIKAYTNPNTSFDEFFYGTNGLLIQPDTALGEPSQSSFFYDSLNSIVRNLESTAFLCNDTNDLGDPIPVILTDPCDWNFYDFQDQIETYLLTWYTSLIVQPSADTISLAAVITQPLSFTFYQLTSAFTNTSNTVDQYNFTIGWDIGDSTGQGVLPPIFVSSAAFLTFKEGILYPCACFVEGGYQNRSTFDEALVNSTSNRFFTAQNPPKVGGYALGIENADGEYTFRRGRIVSVNEEGETIGLKTLDYADAATIFFYYNMSRALDAIEVISGLDDGNLAAEPFRCPDGSLTAATTVLQDVPTSCNCTYFSNTTFTFCNCTDLSSKSWSCSYGNQTGTCGFPATPDYAITQLNTINDLLDQECSCILYDPTTEDLINTTISKEGYNENIVQIDYTFSQVPAFLGIVFNDSITGFNVTTDLLVFGTSLLFWNTSVPIDFVSTDFNETDNSIWLTLFVDPDIAFSALIVDVSSMDAIGISNVVLQFSTFGFPLGQIEEPTFTASSNVANASLVNLVTWSFWEPSDDEIIYPIYIGMHFSQRYFAQYVRVIFEQAGIFLTEEIQVPQRIYFQGANEDIEGHLSWYTLTSWAVYAPEGSWLEKHADLRNISLSLGLPFTHFRLVSPGLGFSVRQWQIYTFQQCSCSDGTSLIVNIESTAGLPSIVEELADVVFLNEHLVPNTTCTCLNNCTLNGLDANNNGICNDAIYQGFLMGVNKTLTNTENNTISFPDGYTTFLYSPSLIAGGIGALQVGGFLAYEDYEYLDPFYTDAELIYLYDTYWSQNMSIVVPNSTVIVNFLYDEDLLFLPQPATTDLNVYYWINQTLSLLQIVNEFTWNDYLSTGLVCEPGFDCTDCGPSSRTTVLLTGYTCLPTPLQSNLIASIATGVNIYNRTFFVNDLSVLTNPWQAFFQQIPSSRTVARVAPLGCNKQVCDEPTDYRCPNGTCVPYKSQCVTLFDCPANGCVELLGISSISTYRCACAPGFAGNACQFGRCRPATPDLPFGSLSATPPAEICRCGGLPPLVLKPPVLDFVLPTDPPLTLERINVLNNMIRAGSAPLSALDIDYHAVLPSFAPWGQVLLYNFVPSWMSPDLEGTKRSFTSDCPPNRIDYYGQQLLLTDDVESRNPITGQPVWKTYINPTTGLSESFPWTSITTYTDAQYRCPNGQCVTHPSDCAQSEALFPLCNGRGTCNSDGTCDCDAEWRTYSINDEVTSFIKYPYFSEDGVTNPTVWEISYIWKHFPQSQCAARNCEDPLYGENNCIIASGCFTGTPSLNFQDRYKICPTNTRGYGFCAPTINDCVSAIDTLVRPQQCFGNGIPRVKDITGEEYCACGTPISPLVNITNVAQITELKHNGWGGPNCAIYYAAVAGIPLIWSSWNAELGEPYRSKITGDFLPGVWIKGDAIVGPRPEDRRYWEYCCSDYDRLERCPFVPCKISPSVVCMRPQDCLAQKGQEGPLIFVCNDHGKALADGTCECDRTDSDGYTYDLTEFSEKGCYRHVACPVSLISGETCNQVSQCTAPEQWRYPMPLDEYFEQQWYTCGIDGKGPFSNATKLDQISVNSLNYYSQLLQSLGQEAEKVLAAIAALAGCICVFPGDNSTFHYGMIENGIGYTYEQNFKSPYLLSLIAENSSDNLLFDDFFTAFQLSDVTIEYPAGTTRRFYLENNATTTISAIRGWGIGQATLFFYNSTGNQVCPPVNMVFSTTQIYLQWILGPTNGTTAWQCGPTYTCSDSGLFPEYATYCNIKPESDQCLTYKKSYCEDGIGGEFWPPDDQLQKYYGCERDGLDNDGCTCCVLDGLTYGTIGDGILDILFSGASSRFGELQVYGLTTQALPMPPGLEEYVNFRVPSNGCHDARYLEGVLQAADQTIWKPYFNETTYREAATICKSMGSFLSIGTDPTADPDMSILQKTCGDKDARCIVAATNPYLNSTLMPRDSFFDETCTFPGCYTFSQSLNTVFFSANNTDAYNAAVGSQKLSDQVPASSFVVYPSGQFPFSNVLSGQTRPLPPSPLLLTQQMRFMTDVNYNNPYLLYWGDTMNWTQTPNNNNSLTRCEVQFFYPSTVSVNVFTFNVSAVYQTQPQGATNKINVMYGAMIDLNDFLFSNNVPLTQATHMTMFPEDCAMVTLSSSFDSTVSSGWDAFINGIPPVSSHLCGIGPYTSWTNSQGYKIWFLNNQGQNLGWNTNPFMRILPSTGAVLYGVYKSYVPKITTGAQGNNRVLGLVNDPYMPMFIDVWVTHCITYDQATFDSVRNLGMLQNPKKDPPIHSRSTPSYFTGVFNPNVQFPFTLHPPASVNAAGLRSGWARNLHVFPGIFPCSTCIKSLSQEFIWHQQYYINSEVGWFSAFTGPETSIRIKSGATYADISTYEQTNPALFVHQVVFIQNRTLIPNPTIVWDVSSCMATTAERWEAISCDETTFDYLCQFDWVKYAVVTGYQCDTCGPSTRSGNGAPIQITCFQDNPLANETANPLPWEIMRNYLRGTLDLWVASNYPEPTEVSFQNKSVIWGFKDAWLDWKNDISTRERDVSINQVPEENWCDMSLTGIFPIDCDAQRNPYTNLIQRFCAIDTLYCNPNAIIPVNALMRNESRPPLLSPVDEDRAYIDKTCGLTIPLSSYVTEDKYGGAQTSVFIEVQVLDLPTDGGAQLYVKTSSALYFNAGKSPIRYVIQWDNPISIYGTYYLNPCPDPCTSPFFKVCIHPLNPYYEEPTDLICQTVNADVAVRSSFLVNFTVDEYETGIIYEYGGFTFPNVTFRGVLFDLGGIPLQSTIELGDPILTDSSLRDACIYRDPPIWKEPLYRIEATSPYRPCLIDDEDLEFYPTLSAGQCACDLSSGGRACDCPAVTSKFGKQVCGGFGNDLAAARAPDGIIYTSGEGTESGCYIWDQGKSSDCNTIDVGTALYTLLVPGSVYAYPSVLINALPPKGQNIFTQLGTTLFQWLTFNDTSDDCSLNGMYLPFWFTVDEFTQFAYETANDWPVPIAVNTSLGNATSWPWNSNLDDTFFINDIAGTYVAPSGICDTPLVCEIANFNNYAYGATIDPGQSAKIDGNTIAPTPEGSGTITFSAFANPEIVEWTIYVFGCAEQGLIDCPTGGFCTDGTVIGTDTIFYCRCPIQIIEFFACTGSNTIKEIQIFQYTDRNRATVYTYQG